MTLKQKTLKWNPKMAVAFYGNWWTMFHLKFSGVHPFDSKDISVISPKLGNHHQSCRNDRVFHQAENKPWKQTRAGLVGGWTNPFEKYDRQIGNLPIFARVRGENQKSLKPPPRIDIFTCIYHKNQRNPWIGKYTIPIPVDPIYGKEGFFQIPGSSKCVKFMPFHAKNLPILAEILHIWRIQVSGVPQNRWYNGKPWTKWMIWGKIRYFRKHPYGKEGFLPVFFVFFCATKRPNKDLEALFSTCNIEVATSRREHSNIHIQPGGRWM